MRNLLNSILILLLAGSLAAQTTTKPAPAKPAEKPAEKLGTHATEDLPSQATVDSFLQQQFGYQPDLSWKISSIRPTGIAGLAEVNVVLASQQGQQLTRF